MTTFQKTSPFKKFLLLLLLLLTALTGCGGGRNVQELPQPAPLGEPPAVQTAQPSPEVAAAGQPLEQQRPGFLRRAIGVLPFVSSGEQVTPMTTQPQPPQQQAARTPAPEPGTQRPGVLRRSLGILPFVSSGEESASQTVAPEAVVDAKVSPRQSNLRGLELAIDVEPETVDLSEDRRLKVRIILRNDGKNTRALKFSSSQHIELMIRDSSGRVVTRWSEDYVFPQVLTSLTVNPEERIEWTETISTRDMVAGRSYTLDVGIAGYGALQVSKPLSPVR